MTNPWKGPRHSSWASNTVLSGIALAIIFVATVLTDVFNGSDPPPTYLTGLLGVAAGSFFGAVGSDRGKREADVEKAAKTAKNEAELGTDTALRAELKADLLAELASREHPDMVDKIPPPLIPPRLRGELPEELLQDDEGEYGGHENEDGRSR